MGGGWGRFRRHAPFGFNCEEGFAGSFGNSGTGNTSRTVETPDGGSVLVWTNPNGLNAALAVSATYWNTQGTGVGANWNLGPGGFLILPHSIFHTVSLPASASIFWALVDADEFDCWLGATGVDGAGNAQVSIKKPLTANGDLVAVGVFGGETQVDLVLLAPASIASATGETVEATGANATVNPSVAYYSLTMSGPLATAADVLTYIAIKGHTSGDYFVICAPGTSVSGWIPCPFAAEKLDIVARNADTVAHLIAGRILIVSP